MTYANIHTILTGLSTILALVAVAVAWRNAVNFRRLLDAVGEQLPKRVLDRCVLRLDDLDERVTQCVNRVQRQHARLATLARMDPKRVESDEEDRTLPEGAPDFEDGATGGLSGITRRPGESDHQWKARVRALLALSGVKRG